MGASQTGPSQGKHRKRFASGQSHCRHRCRRSGRPAFRFRHCRDQWRRRRDRRRILAQRRRPWLHCRDHAARLCGRRMVRRTARGPAGPQDRHGHGRRPLRRQLDRLRLGLQRVGPDAVAADRRPGHWYGVGHCSRATSPRWPRRNGAERSAQCSSWRSPWASLRPCSPMPGSRTRRAARSTNCGGAWPPGGGCSWWAWPRPSCTASWH